jgi:hypothetical protein
VTTSPTRQTDATRAGPDGPVLAGVGVGLLALGSVLVLVLHVLPPSNRVNPWTRTISEYALGANGWMFDLGVLALAAGSLAIVAALARARAVPARGGAVVFTALWAAGLVMVVVFEKYDFAHGVHSGPSGLIHRAASLVAFLSLPVGALLATRGAGARNPGWRRPAARARWAALVSCACLAPLVYAIGRGVLTDVAWWRVFPLGALERLIALSEVITMVTLGLWARVARPATPARSALADPLGDGGCGTPLVQ